MPYTTDALKTVAECDALLDIAEDEKRAMVFKKTSLDYRVVTGNDTASEIAEELQSVRAELAGLDAIIAAFPDGKEKNTYIAKRKSLEAREIRLTNRSVSNDAVSRLEKEYDLARLNREIEETDIFIAAIQARKTQLTS